jgi:hypothetical protein
MANRRLPLSSIAAPCRVRHLGGVHCGCRGGTKPKAQRGLGVCLFQARVLCLIDWARFLGGTLQRAASASLRCSGPRLSLGIQCCRGVQMPREWLRGSGVQAWHFKLGAFLVSWGGASHDDAKQAEGQKPPSFGTSSSFVFSLRGTGKSQASSGGAVRPPRRLDPASRAIRRQRRHQGGLFLTCGSLGFTACT